MNNSLDKKIFLISTLVITFVALSYSLSYFDRDSNIQIENTADFSKIVLNNKEYPILLAKNPEERASGLGNKEDLKENGMLFVFEKPDYHGIWMKDMKFSIDIIWLDSDFRIIDLMGNVSPDTFPRGFYPKSPSSYVFEAKAGFADEFNLEAGEFLKFLP